MNAACILLVLGLAQPRADWDVFLAKLESTNQRDGKALLDLGRWCEENKLPSRAALCYEKVIKLGASGANEDPFVESSFLLARIEIGSGKHEKAYARLRELLRKKGHEEARRLLQKAETNQTREQLKHFEKGNQLLAKGTWKKAAESFEEAYKLLPAQASGAAFIPRPAILAKLAECRARIDDEYYATRVKRERIVEPCPICVFAAPPGASRATPGFVTCPKCGGRGSWFENRRFGLGGLSRMRSIKVTCGGQNDAGPGRGCGGRGYVFCGNCAGLGQVSRADDKAQVKAKSRAKDKGVTRAEWEAHLKVLDRVRRPEVFQSPLDLALEAVQRVLLEEREGSTLNYLRSMEHDYALSKDLRKALVDVPPALDDLRKAAGKWRALQDSARGGVKPSDPAKDDRGKVQPSDPKKDDRAKVNFLLCYACEYSDYLRHFEMLRGVSKPNLRVPDWSRFTAGDVLCPELLSAFPDEGKVEWRAVKGFLVDVDNGELREYKYKDLVKVEGAIPHDVNFFVWRESAKLRLQQLGRGEWREFIGELPTGYPFDIGKEIRQVPRDHQVILVGRFLRNRLGHPRNWFEVWHFEVGLSRAQEEIHRVLSEKDTIEIPSPGIPISGLAQYLSELRGLSVRFEGVSDMTAIQCEARDVSLGLLLDEIARSALQCGWYHEKGQLIFSLQVPAVAARDMAAVLAELRKASPGEIKVGRAAERPDVSILPDDPAGLRVVAAEEMRGMRYDKAAACLEKLEGLLAAEESVATRKAVSRLLRAARLLDELTGKTPVSHLVRASELMEVMKPTGEFVRPRIVSVLGKGPGGWRVQEAYGIVHTDDPSEYASEPRPIPVAEWRAGKEKALRRLEDELEKASPESRPGQLLLLANFAKTHGFAAEGAEYLMQAMELPEFGSFLATHPDERHEYLLRLWREATGRPVEESAPAVPAPAPKDPGISVASVEPMPEGLAGAELLTRATEYFTRGKACYLKMLEGPDAGEWGKQALANCEEAEKGVRRYLQARPDDDGATKLVSRILELRSDTNKAFPLFD